ncbi:citron Rho-interacting kinase-like isoform X2 [Zerene cesonia]|uniref:citron Rho-interacting kinase-like isoform X2 n=1 Tax=Zerene cesonia TaxID=33412 RepID=UPI0018E51447|nr:citron Rho-interacting kinase-like isoform X2 [Zerene cesonia]
MEPSKDAIAVRITRLNRLITGKVTNGTNKISKKIDRETLLDALTVLYEECNEDPIKKADELVRMFVDKYRSALAELRSVRISISDFEILQTIGRGQFGEVHMVREKQTGDVYALKSVRKEQARKRVSGAADERDILATASGQWIPKLQYAFQDNSNLYLVMELCNGGDLASFLSRCSHPLSERDAAFYVAEVAHALKALHGMGFVHRDVKPANLLIDRCGHIKLGDFGSCARLSEGGCVSGVTADYVAPELLAAADCASHTHTSACDYWSLGVIAFELVTLKRPFSSSDDDSVAQVLSNIQTYERDPSSEPPFEPLPNNPSSTWRGLVCGLLRVQPARRYNYLDTLRHPALAHIALHAAAIRDQPPPWVPSVRGPEDARYLSSAARVAAPACAAPFRTRPPFAGQLPFVGYSYVAPEESEETISSFTSSHDCTAIDLATFKSAEKLASIRAKEIASLQSRLAAAECEASAAAERARRDAEDGAERLRARLQADITALALQNRRLERQLEVEKEERMALERSNQELSSGIKERSNAEIRAVKAQASELQTERDLLKEDMARLETRVRELQVECTNALAAAETARSQHKHYKDTLAKERALRRQTLSGSESDAARAAAAEASAARELRARTAAEGRLAAAAGDAHALRADLERVRDSLAAVQDSAREKDRLIASSNQQLHDAQTQLAQEKMRNSSLQAQLQELERGITAAAQREAALEEQSSRTEVRLQQRLEAAEARAASALQDDARHKEKVTTLEQLVRQLEREVSAMENRACVRCIANDAANANANKINSNDTSSNNINSSNINSNNKTNGNNNNAATNTSDTDIRLDSRSDTESVADGHVNVQVTLLKEQLERAEAQLQARADEIAALRQEARTANLARWRKEKEYSDLSLDAKVTARDLKRAEERKATLSEGRKVAEEKASKLEKEIATLKPQYEQTKKEMERYQEQLNKLQKTYDVLQAEVDRSRNDIRKLRSEVQYSEKRRLHAETQEELSARERAQLRDELAPLRAQNDDLLMNNKALQEACSLLEEQLTDLEKLADIHEMKNKELEGEVQRMRSEVEACRGRAAEAERLSAERALAAAHAAQREDDARERLAHALSQLDCLKERLESREALVSELEGRVAHLESETAAQSAALASAARRLRDLQEESAALRTRALHDHALALRLQASLADQQEEASASREAHEAAAAWWRTRETKADATIRQQAKLIDFLQAKVEEAGRKKCSLSNKLFGRSGRRTAASPPLLRVNRELREEVERLRAKLSAANLSNPNIPPTPKRERSGSKLKKLSNGPLNFDLSDNVPEKDSLLVIWGDGTRERMIAAYSDGALVLSNEQRELRAQLHEQDAADLPHNEANRAFTVKLEQSAVGNQTATVVCSSIPERSEWLSRLAPRARPPPPGYAPAALLCRDKPAHAALYVAPNAVAIGYPDGLYSLRGSVAIEWEGSPSPGGAPVALLAGCGGRALLAAGGRLAHAGLLALGSALRRASSLKPALPVRTLRFNDATPPHLIKAISSDANSTHGICVAIACGRKVYLLKFDAADAEFKTVRSLTVDRPPTSLLLTSKAVYIAGEKPLKVNLPSGALETYAMEEPVVAAAAKKHSPPKAIILIKEKPLEILLCYAECGVFIDENGKRSRNEDPKWSAAVHSWEYISPFLYAVGEDRVTIIYLSDDAYRAPPCTCDTTSLASTNSECYSAPEIFNYKVNEPSLLGKAPGGIIIRSKTDSGYEVSIVEGMAAFRSIGASLESLASFSKGSSSDLTQSLTDLSPQDESHESVEVTTGFLADIRNRAKQLRNKQRKEMQTIQSSDDIIKEILTTEVGLRRPSTGRRSPVISEFDSDSETESEEGTGSTKNTQDVCAEIFTRQVRFQ